MATKQIPIKSEKGKKHVPAETTTERIVSPLVELRHRMDDLFDDVMQGWRNPIFCHDFWHPHHSAEPLLSPKMTGDLVDAKFDISEDDKAFEISAELPGMDESDVEVSIENGAIMIKGEKKSETEEKKKDYYRSERRFGSVMRCFQLPDTVDESAIKATFDKGILDISLPKNPEAKSKAKKIEISSKK